MTKAKEKEADKDYAVEMTDDYNIFKTIKGNRLLDERHVRFLMRKMATNDLFTPILVNKNLEVIDGQHRLEARKRLKLIVPYLVVGEYGIEEVQILNSHQKRWTTDDYTRSYIIRGIKDYEIYEWFRKTYDLPHGISVALLSGENYTTRKTLLTKGFQEGSFKVKTLEEAKAVGDKFKRLAPYFEGYRDRAFAVALMRMLDKKAFDFEKFFQKMKSYSVLMKKCPSTEQYIELIEKIYNYRSVQKVGLKYAE